MSFALAETALMPRPVTKNYQPHLALATATNAANATVAQHKIYVVLKHQLKRAKALAQASKKNLLAGLDKIEHHVVEKPLFFDKDRALHYQRFMGQDYFVLALQVPETAIEGDHTGLMLKKGMVTQQHICGCVSP